MAKINFPSESSAGFSGDVVLAINDAKTKAALGFDGLSSVQLFGDALKGTAESALWKEGKLEIARRQHRPFHAVPLPVSPGTDDGPLSR